MRILQTITLLAVLVLATSCGLTGNTTVEQGPIKIGFVGPLTGPVANPGVFIKNAFELANEQQSTVSGRPIEVIFEDGRCNPKEAVNAARKLLDVDDVDILVSAVCGGSTLAMAPLAQDKILFTPASSTPAISDAGDHVFRTSVSANMFAEKTAAMMLAKGFERVAIVVEDTDFPIGWKDAFLREFKGTITTVQVFNSGAADVRTELMKVDRSEPDAILLLAQSPVSAITLLKQADELGVEAQIVGNQAFFARQVMKSLGPVAEGVLMLSYDYNLDSAAMQSLMADYEARFGEAVPEEMYAALSFDGYNVLFDALTACPSAEQACLQEQLLTVKNREGASGVFSINANGDGVRKFAWWQVANGILHPKG